MFKTRVEKQYTIIAAPNREQALKYVSYVIDEYGKQLPESELDPKSAILVGWQCGFEPMYVAIKSEDSAITSEVDAEDIVRAFLEKKKWFSGGVSKDCDYIHMPE